MDKEDPKNDKEFIGKVCIRLGNENQEPLAVVPTGYNGFDLLSCKVLNTGNLVFGGPFIDFDIEQLQILRAEWRLNNAKESIKRFQKDVDNLKKKSSINDRHRCHY